MSHNSPKQALGLRWALLLYVVAPLIIALGLAGYTSLYALENWIEKRLQAEIALIAEALQLSLSRAIERVDRSALDDTLESAFRLQRVFGVYLYDLKGQVLAAAGAKESPALAEQLVLLAGQGQSWGSYDEIADHAVYSYFVPLTSTAGYPSGVLRVTHRASDLYDYLAELRSKALVGLLGAGLITVALVLLGHHFAIGKSLQGLVVSMARVAEGDRAHRTLVQGPHEIAALGLALNQMLDSIEGAESELKRRHQFQADLERRLQRAETMASLGRLAGGVAHELGTPLSIVDGKAQRLLRRSECPATIREALKEIRLEVRRMEQIVRQLLEFGRNQGGHRRAMPASRLAEMAASGARPLFDKAGTRLEVGESSPGALVSVNPMRVEQALVNLLKNACQAAPGGRVRLAWCADGSWVEFRIEDNGPGVPEQLRRRIIEPFFTTKGVDQGSGLGLTVVESVAEEHGGSLEVAGSDLGGAAFSLRLPQAADNSGEADD